MKRKSIPRWPETIAARAALFHLMFKHGMGLRLTKRQRAYVSKFLAVLPKNERHSQIQKPPFEVSKYLKGLAKKRKK